MVRLMAGARVDARDRTASGNALGTQSLTVEGKDLFRSDLLEGDFRIRAWSWVEEPSTVRVTPAVYSIWPRRVAQRDGKRLQLDYLSTLSLPQSLARCYLLYLIGYLSTLNSIASFSNHGTEHKLFSVQPLYVPP